MLFCQCICSWSIVFWYLLFFSSGKWCWFWLEYTWFWVSFVILPWIHLILSWFCDFALNTLDSELVLCLHLIYQNAGYCFWYQLYCLWHYQKSDSFSKICRKNTLCVAGFVIAISRWKCSKNASHYVCYDTNLWKVLTVKINARVMMTINVDVTDGLTNGAMDTVTCINSPDNRKY